MTTSSSRRAACACGKLSITCDGEPVRVSMCHCLACKQRTGSAFGWQARFPTERTRIEGASTTFVRRADSGNDVTFHFCPACGTTMYWQLHGMPEFVVVAAGAFADPAVFGAPVFSVYEARKNPWVNVPDDAEHWD
jgi:hypothetical protein